MVSSSLLKVAAGVRGCPVVFLGNGFLVLLDTRDKSSDCTLDSGGAVFRVFLVEAFGEEDGFEALSFSSFSPLEVRKHLQNQLL